MQKYILATLICSTTSLRTMNKEENKTLTSLAPKCISFCKRTIERFKSNLLRASKETTPYFEQQINAHTVLIEKIQKAQKNKSSNELETSFNQFTNLIPGNILLLSSMWPQRLTQKETDLIKKLKTENEKK